MYIVKPQAAPCLLASDNLPAKRCVQYTLLKLSCETHETYDNHEGIRGSWCFASVVRSKQLQGAACSFAMYIIMTTN